jgi:predicted DNA binding CopG/RHH family protein
MNEAVVKTTIRVEAPLWRRARIRALQEGIPVQDLVRRAIEVYLQTKPSRKEDGR